MPLVKLESISKGGLDVTNIISKRRSRMSAKVIYRDASLCQMKEIWWGSKCVTHTTSDCTVFIFSSGINAIQEWYLLQYTNILAKFYGEKIAMGYKADELLATCFFDGLSCDSRLKFHSFHHPLYGNATRFNSADSETLLVSSMGGMEYGLKVVLYIDENDNTPSVHIGWSQDSKLETAMESSIGMQLTESTKLSNHTVNICLHSCFQRAMVQTCGCAYYNHPLPNGAKYCNFEQFSSWMYCYFKLHKKFVQEELGCQSTCRESCSFKEWTLTRSLAKWPSLNSEEWMLRVLSWELGNKLKKNLTKHDLANLALFYQDLNSRSISESPTYNIVTLLSNFGGQLGLWMSCSMVCVLEIFEVFFIDSLWVVLRQQWHKLCNWWKNHKGNQAEQNLQIPVPTMTGHDNPVCLVEEDPPTFNSALQLPQAQNCQVPRTPPPKYNTLRIQSAFQAEIIEDVERF
ncbi:hypothetical protein GDO86_017426 [Hymenochirus boettgeri]|uniref:Amiloride-sensitive sodium channel subunit gamma n=1 Tax=Hymenochirus boettgeri TaxID=247094 RepID=A0A8T2ING1_9PIPI|nr:hypothetical protein GDO86_017426 [Hymenochirus boettgeri]